MVSNEIGDGSAGKSVVTMKGNVRDRREMEVREAGLVVTHRIASTTAKPVEFQVVDQLHGTLDIEEIGFHPEHEPPHGRIDGDQAVMSGVVHPDEDLVITYGVRLVSRPPAEDLRELAASTPPMIELSKTLDPDAVEEADPERAAMPRSSGAAEPADGGSVAFFDWLRRNLQPDEASTDASTHAAAGGEPTPGTAEEAAAVEEPEPTNGPGGAAGGREPVDDGPPEATTAGDEASEEFDYAAAEDDPEPETSGEVSRESEPVDAPDEAGTDRPREEGVAETLLDELESGALSADQRRRLASALLDVLGSEDAPRYSTEVRLRKLESSMQEFAAYADALGAIIDEHGPAEEFLGEVRAELGSLGDAVDSLRGDLDRAAETRRSLDDRLDAVADEVAVLSSRLERLDDHVETVRADHRTQASAFERKLEALEPAVDRVEELSSSIESLRADVDEVRTRHRAIARAFRDEPDRR